jgi:Tol biopolymer transport system component
MKRKAIWILLLTLILTVSLLGCNGENETPAPEEPEPEEPVEEPVEEPEEPEDPLPAEEGLLVYSGGGDLWLVEGESDPRQLTSDDAEEANPIISPDGEWVVYQRVLEPGPTDLPQFEMRVVSTDGEEDRALVEPDDLPGEMGTPLESDEEVMLNRLPWRVEWVPDGDTVAFSTYIESGYGLLANWDLWEVDVESGEIARLLEDGEGGVFAHSPDGSQILVSDPTTVSLVDAGGGNRRELVVFERVNTASEYAYAPQPVWAPDGSYGLVAISAPEPFAASPSVNLWRLPLDGDPLLMATLPGPFLFNTMSDRLWSSDRAHLAYVDGTVLIVANADGSEPQDYAAEAGDFKGWAPEGERFLYSEHDRPSRIILGELDEDPRPLVSVGEVDIFEVQWLDEDTFAYTTGDFESRSLYVADVGGEPRLVSENALTFDAMTP